MRGCGEWAHRRDNPNRKPLGLGDRVVRSERAMRDSQIIHQLLVVGALLSVALAAACGGDSSSKSDDSNGAGGSGGGATTTSGATGPGAGGSEASATTTGGSSTNDSSNAASATGGTGGGTSAGSSASGGAGGSTTGMGGAGAQGGEGGDAGTTNAGGTTSTGGSAGDGGSGGSGGAPGPVTVVGMLGDACDSPGALACSGNHQKLTVVCGGEGEWEANQTCGATEFCDSVEGDTTGLCLEPDAECEGRGTEERFCMIPDAYSCFPDGVRPALAERCVAGCENGVCFRDRDPCPTGDSFLNCDTACGGVSSQCEGSGIYVTPPEDQYVFRTGGAQDSILGCDGQRYAHFLNPGVGQTRAVTTPPWSVSLASGSVCSLPESQCALGQGSMGFIIFTDDPEAPPANVLFERVPPEETCPVP